MNMEFELANQIESGYCDGSTNSGQLAHQYQYLITKVLTIYREVMMCCILIYPFVHG